MGGVTPADSVTAAATLADLVTTGVKTADQVTAGATFDDSVMVGVKFADSVVTTLNLDVEELGTLLNLFLLSMNCFICRSTR